MREKNNKLFLDETSLIAEGAVSRVYLHPNNKSLCIKIPKKDVSSKKSRKRENKYLRSLKKRGRSFEMLYEYHYDILTNLGKGHVYDLVRDYNGETSKNLGYYLELGDQTQCNEIVRLIDRLRVYLAQEYILFWDLHEENILLQNVSSTEKRLVVIDGIEYNNRIPILEYVPAFGRKRQTERWEVFRKKMIKLFPCLEDKIKKFSK